MGRIENIKLDLCVEVVPEIVVEINTLLPLGLTNGRIGINPLIPISFSTYNCPFMIFFKRDANKKIWHKKMQKSCISHLAKDRECEWNCPYTPLYESISTCLHLLTIIVDYVVLRLFKPLFNVSKTFKALSRFFSNI